MIWYPYEQMKTMKEPYKILDAEGVYLYTKDQKLIDSVSSWWCMIHGYKHPELTAAIKEQADHFCHVMLGGLTHEPVERLSAKLQEFLPGDLDYCFFSDSGSVAVEVSLKMALRYSTNQGRKRPLVLALEHAYHGDTFKAMEVGDDEDYHFAFDKKDVHIHVPEGATPKDGPSAGVTLFTALASLVLKKPVKKKLAMTGEVSLRGEVLPIGGLPEKLMAAQRAGITTVLIPKKNEEDLKEVPEEITGKLSIIPVETIAQVAKESMGVVMK